MKSTSSFEYAEVINILAEGLRLGLFTKQQVTQWADSFILRDKYPDIFFIELALSPNEAEAVTLLNEAVRRMAIPILPRPLLGAIYRQVLTQQKPAVEAARSLEYFIEHDELLTKQESSFILALYSAATLLETAANISIRELEEDTVTFLSTYQHYTIDNYARWTEIDQEVNQQLAQLQLQVTQEHTPPLKVLRTWWQFWKF